MSTITRQSLEAATRRALMLSENDSRLPLFATPEEQAQRLEAANKLVEELGRMPSDTTYREAIVKAVEDLNIDWKVWAEKLEAFYRAEQMGYEARLGFEMKFYSSYLTVDDFLRAMKFLMTLKAV